jgi:predicted ribosomally synthesized peptide with SipW-like signal peptide
MMHRLLMVLLLVGLIAGQAGIGTTAYFTDAEPNAGNTFEAWISSQWMQTTQADFNAGVPSNVDTSSSPGDVKLAVKSGWYNTFWSRRKPITINNTGSSLTDYQVKVNVTYDSDMKPNFDDIRFADADGSTLLPHWRESYTASTSAIFWVKVPSVPSGSKTIYMYYGNAAASSASDGAATFVFFDDFSGNLSKWNIHIGTQVAITSSYGNPAPCLEISGGITSSPYGFAAIGSDATYSTFQNGIIEADIYPATVALPEIIFRGNYSANTGYKGRWDCRTGTESPWMKPPYSGWAVFGTAVTRFGIANQWQKAKLVINGSTFGIYSNDSLKSTATDTQYSGPGEIGLANHYGTYARFDNVRVRKYASPEPTTSVGSEEGMYVSTGTIASQVLDTGISGATWNALFWDETTPASTNITFEVRASNTSFLPDSGEPPSWVSVGGTSPVTSGLPSGRYMQWRATLTTSDTSKTPTLHEVTIDYY